MAEPAVIMFSFAELTELMIKKQDIHQGHWSLVARFGISATNAALPNGEVKPTAIVPLLEIGVQKSDEPTPMSLDAATVNPSKKQASKTKSSKAR